MESRLLIRCGKLLTGRGDVELEDMGVRVRAGRIVEVSPWSEIKESTAEIKVDYSEQTVCPGFIDSHVHLIFTCDVDHTETRADVESASVARLTARAASNALEALLGGVTTARDCGDRDLVSLAIRDATKDGQLPGPRILAAGPPLTTARGHLNWCGNTAETTDEIREAVRKSCDAGVDVIKVMASGGNMTSESDVHHPQYDVSQLTVAVEEAHRSGRRVAAHALNAESIRRSVAAGVDTLEHCLWRNADSEAEDADELVRLLERSAASVVLTMAGIARALLSGKDGVSSNEYEIARKTSLTGDLFQDYEWARKLLQSKVNVVIASDAGVRFTPFRRFDESIQCAIEALGITPSQAVSLVTQNAAISLGLEDEVGLIEKGMLADLVVLDGGNSSTRIGSIAAVYKAGELVVDGGQLIWGGQPS